MKYPHRKRWLRPEDYGTLVRECLLSRESDGATTKDFIRAVPAKKTAYALKFLKRFGVPGGI
jgi:hypothetical protein